MTEILLPAPVSGLIVPLSEVPDPVFSQRMLGDGIAIAPDNGLLISPCAGRVSQLHSAGHALTITSDEGVQILLHIGLETVALKGQGFAPKVALGDEVRRGQLLVEFDRDYVAARAHSALTMMVIAENDLIFSMQCATGRVTAGESTAVTLSMRTGEQEQGPAQQAGDPATGRDAGHGAAADGTAEGTADGAGAQRSRPLIFVCPNGIHARPAAVLAQAAKRYAADIVVTCQGRTANAKSVSSLLGLNVRQHDSLVISAEGSDAAQAVSGLVGLVESGLGENACMRPAESAMPSVQAVSTVAEPACDGRPDCIGGIPASPGKVAGTLAHWKRESLALQNESGSREEEENLFEQALAGAREELHELRSRLRKRADPYSTAIFEAHTELLDDPELTRTAKEGIATGKSAARAWQDAVTAQAESIASLDNTLLAARADDIRDVGRRVLARMAGLNASSSGQSAEPSLPEKAIIIAEELSPSEVDRLAALQVCGICTVRGSATSHASLLARASGIPALAAMDERVRELADGTPAVLDADAGELLLNPTPAELDAVRVHKEKIAADRQAELLAAAQPAVTLDGERIRVAATIGGLSEVKTLLECGGEGVGLLRSEFLFLQRTSPPDEEEQAAAYAAIATALGPDRELVIRTLDAGGDKTLPYLPLPPQNNPFLGIRGIRVNMLGTQLFRVQVRAALRVASQTRLHIIFPMITDISELRAAKSIVAQEKAAIAPESSVAVGIMVEVPSAALLAESLAGEVDFFSIGTNDLTQHTLAIDRGHPQLAPMADGLHPAVLRLIDMTVQGAHKRGKWVGVCGGLAARPEAIPLLIGLGVDELSVSVDALAQVKSLIRQQNMAHCRTLAADALTMVTAAEVQQYLRKR